MDMEATANRPEEVTEMETNNELWTDLGGMMSCRQHMGGYATSALEQTPKARKIETPITVWHKMTAAECVPQTVTYDDGYSFEFVPACERCEYGG